MFFFALQIKNLSLILISLRVFLPDTYKFYMKLAKRLKFVLFHLVEKCDRRNAQSTVPFKIYFYFSRLDGLSEGSGRPSYHNYSSTIEIGAG